MPITVGERVAVHPFHVEVPDEELVALRRTSAAQGIAPIPNEGATG